MAKHKEPARRSDASPQTTGKIIIPTKDETDKFGRHGDVQSDGIQDSKKAITEALGPNFEKVISGYSDEQLKQIVEKKGLGGLFQQIMEEAMFGDTLPQLKQMMKEHRRGFLSAEVEDYFDDVKARCLLRNGGAHFQVMKDDRLGENMDISLALFELNPKLEVPGEENTIEKYHRVLQSYPESVSEFLMRVPSEHFKLLIYYCKLEGFEDIKKIMEHRGNVNFESLSTNRRLRNIFQDPIELICSIHERRLEDMMKSMNMSSMEQFHDLFFKTPDLIMFLKSSHWSVVKKIMEIGKANSVESFQKLFADDDFRGDVEKIKPTHGAEENFRSVLDAFGINNLKALKAFLKSDFPFYQMNEMHSQFLSMYIKMSEATNTSQLGDFLRAVGDKGREPFFAPNLSEVKKRFGLTSHEQMMNLLKQEVITTVLPKADPKNLRILLSVSPYKGPGDLCAALLNPETAHALENAKYNALQELFDSISQDEGKKSFYLYNLINKMDSENFGYIYSLQSAVKRMKEAPSNLIDLVYLTLSKPGATYQNIQTFCDLIEKKKLTVSGDVDAILRLMKFSDGVLTGYLASSFMPSKEKDALLKEWTKTLESFERGMFDSNSELHRNLEYLRFRKIIDNEKLRKHIKNAYTYGQYLQIFEKPQQAQEPEFRREQMEFEINCVAYEAKLLRNFITDVAKVASGMGRKTLVVPNLSYGYLPVSPLIDELASAGVEFAIGAKIGSTQCHDNHDYINSALFKGHRTEIVNDQPVIIVVDGTRHMVEGRDDHNARYPDAYHGFLNHVIALNDSYGFANASYGAFGKAERDMASLRADFNFGTAVETYQKLRKEGTAPVPYGFGFWNSAGLGLAIRNKRNEVSEFKPIGESEIKGPIVIFANVGVLHDQIPESIRSKFKDLTHTPAYFDDTGKIINFDFSFDNYGVKYLNRLETEVKMAYHSSASIPNDSNPDVISGLIRFVKNHLPSQPE